MMVSVEAKSPAGAAGSAADGQSSDSGQQVNKSNWKQRSGGDKCKVFYHGFRFGQFSITPDPTSSSPSYHAANCPGVMPRWGSSNRIYSPSGRMWSVAPCKGWR